MKVDVQSLETFNQLAHEGARTATESMAQMTGLDVDVSVTTISLVDRETLGEELGRSGEYAGVIFEFEGGLPGRTAVLVDRAQRDAIVEAIYPGGADSEAMARDGIGEIANVMMSGYLDGWAAYLDTTIEHSPPTYVEGSGSSLVTPGDEGAGADDQLFVFRSSIRGLESDSSCYFYLIPDFEPLATLMAERVEADETAFPIDKLAAFNELTRLGGQEAATNVEELTGVETTAEVSQLSFAPVEAVPRQFESRQYAGTVVEFSGPPSGFLAVLFEEAAGRQIANRLLGVETAESLTDRHAAALEELGNIVTSGYVDAWANVLQQSIDHCPPRYVHDRGQAVVSPLVAQVGQHQPHAFSIDSRMRTETMDFACDVLILPENDELREALTRLDSSRTSEVTADPGPIFRS